jgi:hypothetical protein
MAKRKCGRLVVGIYGRLWHELEIFEITPGGAIHIDPQSKAIDPNPDNIFNFSSSLVIQFQFIEMKHSVLAFVSRMKMEKKIGKSSEIEKKIKTLEPRKLNINFSVHLYVCLLACHCAIRVNN